MRFRDVSDEPEITGSDSFDHRALERKIRRAKEVEAAGGAPPGDGGDVPPSGDSARPGRFRYSDAELGGEVRTSVAQEGGLYSVAQAEVFRPDGTTKPAGKAYYTVAGSEATLDDRTFIASNHGTESALLKEVGEQAQAQGADQLRVWVRDDDPDAGTRWLRHGFQPTERDPGAAGIHWERRL